MAQGVDTVKREQVVGLRLSRLSYAEIGRRLGVTRERVRQILKGSRPKPRKPANRSKAMLSVGKVANLLGIHVNTVRRWSDRGILEAHRVGSRSDRRFRRRDIEEFAGKK